MPPPPSRTFSDEARFLEKVMPEPMSGCWLWIGARSKNGYGAFSIDGKIYGAHTVAFTWYVRPLYPGELVCHKCDVQVCINPRDLFPGTYLDNNSDRSAKGRTARLVGQNHAQARLTNLEAQEIRRLALSGKIPEREIAEMYGIAQSTVSDIKTGRSYT